MKNGLTSLPPLVFEMPALKELSFQENQIESIQGVFDKLPQLEMLDCSDNPITSIDGVEKLAGLTTLAAYKMKLKQLPIAMFSHCTRLEDLNVYNNQLAKVPVELRQLKELKEFNVASNKLMQLPDGCFEGMPKLRRVAVFWNKIIKLPSFKDLVGLEELQLNSNSLNSVPEFGYHPKLNNANLNKNMLTELPEAMFSAQNLPELECLEVGSNDLTSVPASLGTLPKLTKLVLGTNKLTSIPDAVWCLPALTFLDVSENKLEEVNPAVQALKDQMVTLFLSKNPIKLLPDFLLQFSKMTRFSVKACPLDMDGPTGNVYAHLETTTEANGGKFIGLGPAKKKA
eukprot:NODE_2797_length_1089_cov_6.939709_g2667_i0.p1 GENE.NODE_2797_length_1089_cov_6.939709_g2667_i0~~NODE_2797_length_1089_cov_6.939709_g2667_i0.p1  ORF type:complete len:342 (-),score=123.66 NODE_2797_length_1089_cov_6.939709_g2667_i0:63-1088(-)